MMKLSDVKQFFNRLLLWRLEDLVNISEKENTKLDKYTPTKESDGQAKTFRQIIVWRISNLQAILPLSFVVLIFDSIKTHQLFEDYDNFEELYNVDLLNGIGTFALISNGVLSTCLLIIGLGFSLFFCYKPKVSISILRWTFLATLIVKLWPQLVQSDAKYNYDDLLDAAGIGDKTQDGKNVIATLRLTNTIQHAIELIPLIVAFPRGATNAALCMFGLKPTAVTPKVLVMYFFPFATMLLGFGTSTFVQMAGDWLLAISLILFFTSDILMYFSFSLIVKGDVKLLATGKKAIARAIVKSVGSILLFAWLCWKVIPCGFDNIQIDDDYNNQYYQYYQYYQYFGAWREDEGEDPHCLILKSIDLPTSKMIGMFFRFLRNFFLAKLIFFDVMMLTLESCEPDLVVGFYARVNDDDNDDDDASKKGGIKKSTPETKDENKDETDEIGMFPIPMPKIFSKQATDEEDKA